MNKKMLSLLFLLAVCQKSHLQLEYIEYRVEGIIWMIFVNVESRHMK